MFILIRAAVYATIFAGFLLWFVPASILARGGLRAPARFGAWQVVGTVVGLAGLGLIGSCILAFVLIGKGTQAPFDPPTRLVARGPYRLLRNPMYLGAVLWVLGLAMFYGSIVVALYAAAFFTFAHLAVVFLEEPALERTFGEEYRAYCRRVRRW